MIETLVLTFQILIMASIVMGLACLRARYTRALLFTFLGATQYLQTLWATTTYITLFDTFTVSPGSVVLYAGSLFAVLIVYINGDVAQTRILIYAIVLANLGLIVLTWTVQVPGLHEEQLVGFRQIPPLNLSAFLLGTLLLALESVMLVVIYETLGHWRVPLLLRLIASLALVLTADSFVWATFAYGNHPEFRSVLTGQVVGKLYASLLYGGMLAWFVTARRRQHPGLGTPDVSRGIFGILQYRSRFREAEARREDTTARFTSILEATPDLVGLIDSRGHTIFLNGSGRTLLGYDESEDLASLHVTDYVPERHRAAFVLGPLAHTVQHGNWSGETTFLGRHGRELAMSQVMLHHPASDATDEYFSTIARDISASKQSAQALQEYTQRLELAQQTARMGFLEWNVASNTVELSAEALRLLRLPPTAAVQTFESILAFVHPDDQERTKGVLQQLLQDGTLYSLDHRMIAADGSAFWVHAQGQIERGVGGEPIRMLGILYDITERMAMEEKLRQSGRLEVVGQLAGGIAHDFNNILTAILGTAELLSADLPTDSPLQQDVEDIQHSAQRAATLTSQLLAFSRRQMLQPVSAPINNIVNDLHRLLRRLIGEHIRLETNIEDGGWGVWADRAQLEQVLVNLVINARDAMPEGGTLTISAREESVMQTRAVYGGDVPPGRWILLSVGDTGRGIPDAILPHIFEPFFTTKGPGHGTGLGLASAYGFVRQSSGHIAVDTEVGKGTTFHLYLTAAPVAESDAGRSVGAATSIGSEHVLLVEDDPDVRRTARRILESRGYHVLDAGTPAEGISLAADASVRIDLLVTDMIMPEMGGQDLAAAVAVHRPDLPVLFMSGFPGSGRREATDITSPFIEKPFLPDDFATAVRDAIDRAPH